MIVGTFLFRGKHVQVRVASAILVFVILYYPVMAANSTASTVPGSPVPILQTASLDARPPISVLSLDEVSTKLGPIIDASEGAEQPYVRSLTEYWPLSLTHRLFPVGVIFGILAAAATGVAAAILLLFGWLERRELGGEGLVYCAPLSSLLAGAFAFSALAGLLSRPLDYTSTMSPVPVLVGAVLVGGAGSFADVWMRRRDVTAALRGRLACRAAAVRSDSDLLKKRADQTKSQCLRMETGGEDALRKMCEQELGFAEQSVGDMSLSDLEQKAKLFEQLQGQLRAAVQETSSRLYQYHDEDWRRFNDYLTLAKGYGFPLGEPFQGPAFSALTTMEHDEVLELQTTLNQRYEAAARSLAGGIEELEKRLRTEVDPDFRRTGIDIARDCIAQQRYAEALQDFLLELRGIEQSLETTLAGLDQEVSSVLESLKTTVSDVLMRTAASLGDAAGVSYYREILVKMETLRDLLAVKGGLPALIQTVTTVGELGDLMASLSRRLGEKLGKLEAGIQDKTPRGYDWGIDPQISTRLTDFSRRITGAANSGGILERMSLFNAGPSIVDAAARAVKDYSIAHELLINFANMEYLMEEKLRVEGTVNTADLPVSRKYVGKCLELYQLKHRAEAIIDRDTGKLIALSGMPLA
ncbi:MAG: hypothetical protein A2147_03190 [Chloroflexi bacterium RBG_16_57_8]|nr:MAG: hypothetical protein A2147_03190 [Chloroflexi bacterium RBG_16_57_8]